MDGIDPKTGKPRADHETGKSMAESVERAIGWARLTGSASSSSLASLPVRCGVNCAAFACQMARNPQGPQRLENDAMDAVLAAADAGCFATYIEKQGGVLVPRKDYLIRTAYDLADELNDYGEQSVQIYGSGHHSSGNPPMCAHPDNWKLVRRKPEPEDSAHENGFDLQGGPAALGLVAITVPVPGNGQQRDRTAGRTASTQWPQLLTALK